MTNATNSPAALTYLAKRAAGRCSNDNGRRSFVKPSTAAQMAERADAWLEQSTRDWGTQAAWTTEQRAHASAREVRAKASMAAAGHGRVS